MDFTDLKPNTNDAKVSARESFAQKIARIVGISPKSKVVETTRTIPFREFLHPRPAGIETVSDSKVLGLQEYANLEELRNWTKEAQITMDKAILEAKQALKVAEVKAHESHQAKARFDVLSREAVQLREIANASFNAAREVEIRVSEARIQEMHQIKNIVDKTLSDISVENANIENKPLTIDVKL